MTRKIKKADLYVGMLVVTSDSNDAQVRTISYIFDNGNMVEVQWLEGTRHCSQGVDYSLLMVPTIKQIESTIANNGHLVSINELMQFA
jgi:hypothetical protein